MGRAESFLKTGDPLCWYAGGQLSKIVIVLVLVSQREHGSSVKNENMLKILLCD